MALDPALMAEISGKESTISNKIRALARAGCSRSDIAKFLQRSYQQVRQVLVEDERRVTRGGELRPSADRNAREESETPSDEESERESKAGSGEERESNADRGHGRSVGLGIIRMTLDEQGRLLLPRSIRAELGWMEGGVVVGHLHEKGLMLTDGGTAVRNAQALVRSLISGDRSLADELIRDRRHEAE